MKLRKCGNFQRERGVVWKLSMGIIDVTLMQNSQLTCEIGDL